MARRKRILLIGYDYPGLQEGFRAIGYEVAGSPQFSPYIAFRNRVPIATFGKQLREWAKGFDVLLLGKGWYNDAGGNYWHISRSALEDIALGGCLTIYWSHDDPYSVSTYLQQGFFRGYRAILTCCRSSVQEYRRGIASARGSNYSSSNRPRVLPSSVKCVWPAWDQANWKKKRESGSRVAWEIPESEKIDFSFVGTPYFAPGWCDFPRARAALYCVRKGYKVELYDDKHSWPDGTPVERRIWRGHPELGPAFLGYCNWGRQFDVYARTRVVWNNFGAVGRGYVNDRIFFQGGVGSFILLDDRCSLGQDFFNRREVVYYSGDTQAERWADWVRKFEHWRRPEKAADRERIGRALRRRIYEAHTYAHRAVQIHRIIERLS